MPETATPDDSPSWSDGSRGAHAPEAPCERPRRPRAPDPRHDLSAGRGLGRGGPRRPAGPALVLGGPDDDPDAGEEGAAPAPPGRHQVRLSAQPVTRLGGAIGPHARD